MADPIDPVSSIAVKKKSVQPVWLSITVPATAAFGNIQDLLSSMQEKNIR